MRGAGDAAFLAVRAVRRIGGGVLFDNLFVVVVGVQVGGVDGVAAVQAGTINLHGINLHCLHAGSGSLRRGRFSRAVHRAVRCGITRGIARGIV